MTKKVKNGGNGLGWVWAAAVLVCSVGCDRGEVRSYRIPKETASAPADAAHGHGTGTGAALPKIEWRLPEGWKEQPAGRMRVAQFVIGGENEPQAEVAVIPLPGMSAGDVELVNLWRDQLQLKHWDRDEVAAQAKTVQIGGDEGRIFDLVSEKPLIEEKHLARTLVAMIVREGTSWFFKMTGPNDLVGKQKEAFVGFLASVRYLASAAGAGQPAANVPPAPPAAAAPPAQADPSRPQWTLPAGWREQAPPPMAMAGFVTEGNASISVTVLEGAAGGTLPNVNRWRGQIKLPPIEQAELDRTTETMEIGGTRVVLVDMSGTSARTGAPTRMVAAIVALPDKTWFYKLQGDDPVVGREKPRFVEFLKSVRYPHG